MGVASAPFVMPMVTDPISPVAAENVISVSARGSRAPSLRLVSFYVFYAFPWHFSEIIWHPGGMPWNSMECHGIPWNAMDVMLFTWNFSGILWHPGGIPWNAMEFHGMPLVRYVISMAIQWNYMAPGGMPWNSIGYRRLVL